MWSTRSPAYHLVGFSTLGEYWTAAKPPSERLAHHLVGFSNLGEHWTAAKPPSERLAHHSVGFFKLRRNGFAAKSPTGGFQTQIKATTIAQEDCKTLVFDKQITKVFLITFIRTST